jgi:two-component system OmpR family response regulator/two-component system response regulator QseB
MSRSESILLVDGDHVVRQRCRELLESAGYMVFESPGAMHARMFLRTITPAAVLIESDLPDGQGSEVVRFVKRELSMRELPVVLMSASDDAPEAADLANAVLHKPFSPEQLVAAVRSACGGMLSGLAEQPS